MCQIPWILRREGHYTTSLSRLFIKANANRCVFSLLFKVACDGLVGTSLGREFHIVGEKENDHLVKADGV